MAEKFKRKRKGLTMPPSLADDLVELAEKDHRSFTNYVNNVLQEHVNKCKNEGK